MIQYTNTTQNPKYICGDTLIHITISTKTAEDHAYLFECREEVYQQIEKIIADHLSKNERQLNIGVWEYVFYLDHQKLKLSLEKLSINHY